MIFSSFYPIINHKDENKLNNNIDNLEWCTAKMNSNHSLAKKVQQINFETNEVIKIYNSISDALKSLNKPQRNGRIGQVCKGKCKSAYGFKWKFI